MAKKQHGGTGTPATSALDQSKVPYTIHTYDHDPASPSYGLEAAEALGRPAEEVFKTLLVDTGAGLAVGVVPVHLQLDLKALAGALGVKRLTMAAPPAAERSSGMVVGGISPIGQRKPLPTVLDASMQDRPTVLVSGGRRGLDVELAPADLARLTAATFAAIAR
ncbi:Cys-tRNA(Pro) deacylase [Tessaracoccus sp. ZS01]|uniref:Cys-tRNA(Pro) deacylase n=1 Tax=Tessaracoccus sp. ZS01 TaxID=1906324 RepID=UPI00096C0E32|nr:Cys-tRNA(Pro) deacylase [Tessaracoccus sp. ZS01]MCG6566365.1 Cys-tRNA(Pro) deacylase [Tessaracoccus sp. ZS01]OMG58831.1 aminoacyl-tRNA deacylase [Tessaracoccus sp. ZS01]